MRKRRLNNLPKVTQLVNDRTEIQSHSTLSPNPYTTLLPLKKQWTWKLLTYYGTKKLYSINTSFPFVIPVQNAFINVILLKKWKNRYFSFLIALHEFQNFFPSSMSIAASLVSEDTKTKFLNKMGQLTTSGAMLANVFQRKK